MLLIFVFRFFSFSVGGLIGVTGGVYFSCWADILNVVGKETVRFWYGYNCIWFVFHTLYSCQVLTANRICYQ